MGGGLPEHNNNTIIHGPGNNAPSKRKLISQVQRCILIQKRPIEGHCFFFAACVEELLDFWLHFCLYSKLDNREVIGNEGREGGDDM